ncbi:MAG: hypothetical protein ACTSPB_00110 [Candidatus Thorarchaeota archaeon]
MDKKEYKKIADEFEGIGGFDVNDMESVTNDVEASIRFMNHISWLRAWAEESAQAMERIIMDKGLYALEYDEMMKKREE